MKIVACGLGAYPSSRQILLPVHTADRDLVWLHTLAGYVYVGVALLHLFCYYIVVFL